MTVQIHEGLDEPGLVGLAGRLGRAWALRPEVARRGLLVGLVGDLGAGKTRFVQGLVGALPGGDACVVTSPTYALVHEYPCRPPVRHVDLYRLAGAEQVEELGPDLLDAPGLVLVEWIDRSPDWKKSADVEIRIAVDAQDTRRVELRPGTPEG